MEELRRVATDESSRRLLAEELGPSIADRLRNHDPKICIYAADMLGWLGACAIPIRDTLSAVVANDATDTAVRSAALKALCMPLRHPLAPLAHCLKSHAAAATMQELRRAATDESSRRLLAEELGPSIADLLRNDDPKICIYAADMLGWLGACAIPFRDGLSAVVANDATDTAVRSAALHALCTPFKDTTIGGIYGHVDCEVYRGFEGDEALIEFLLLTLRALPSELQRQTRKTLQAFVRSLVRPEVDTHTKNRLFTLIRSLASEIEDIANESIVDVTLLRTIARGPSPLFSTMFPKGVAVSVVA